jgi:hypothetical protein
VEISINAKQIIALVWTLVAFVISIVITLAVGIPSFGVGGMSFGPWPWLVALFFGLFLVITVPVYLLLALLHIVSKWDTT